MFYNDHIDITADDWLKILSNKDIVNDRVLNILHVLLECDNYEARASYIASKLSISHHGPLNLEIGRFSKHVIEILNIKPPCRSNGKPRWWHVPFLGYEKGGKFPWILRPELAEALEIIVGKREGYIKLPEEVYGNEKALFEGKVNHIYVNAYERNQHARSKCLMEYGYKCVICGFDFEKIYGPIGKNKIHVHHKKPLSEIKNNYEVDPIRDLCPVCPNCHLIIHSTSEPFTIEEMIQIVNIRHLNDRY